MIHHYGVSGDCTVHAFLRGSYMVDLLYCPTGPVPMHIGRPNAAGIRGPGPIHRQINRFRCLEMLSNVRRTTILRFAKLLGLSPRLCSMRHHMRHLGSPLRVRVRCPTGATDVFGFIRLAATDLACVVAITALRAGYRAVVFGCDSEVPIIGISSPVSRSSSWI